MGPGPFSFLQHPRASPDEGCSVAGKAKDRIASIPDRVTPSIVWRESPGRESS
jgi:hypothetical protein